MKKIYFIIGPTASGKTSLSIELAKKLGNTEIISADSRQIYKDLDLSTGKVTKEEMSGIPHHMLDIVNPGEYFSVVDYTDTALRLIKEIQERGNTPIIVGGTGFYIDSLIYKYNLPEVKKDDELRKELSQKTHEELFELVKQYDPKYAQKIENNPDFRLNRHRLMRTIEVAKALGHFPELIKEPRFHPSEIEIIRTNIPKDILKQKIHTRLLERIEQGMIEEVKMVKEKYHLSDKYLSGLGLEFKWVNKYLNNEITKQEMIDGLYIEICQYAKRQETWFKRYSI